MSILHYDPDTGVFTWLKSLSYRTKVGAVAGALDGRKRGYIEIRIRGYLHKAHRLAFLYMTGEMPSSGVDHINGIYGDNRFCNLRIADQSVNCRNMSMRKDNTSGAVGVSWDPRKGKWYVRISTAANRPKFCGYFHTLIDAVAHRKRLERKYDYHPNHGRQGVPSQ
jgi:hypothetical protein